MDYEWDPAKAKANLAKHGVDFADAVLALDDDHCLTVQDDSSVYESRFVTLGADPYGKLLIVVFTHRGDSIRIISARGATKQEQRHYEAQR